MIRAGDSVVNPVTGERLVFLETSQETGGEYARFETYVEPNGSVAGAHVHPFQTEYFECLGGRLSLKVGGDKLELAPGEAAVVEPGKAHKFWNASDDVVRFVCTVRPALEFESLIETMYGLAADGKTNRKGMPSPLRLAVIARHHFDVVRLPVVPHWMQRVGLAIGAPVGRALGYTPMYEPTAGELVVA